MSKITMKGINKFYGSNHVLKDLDLTIEDGEFMTLLGPSGCGKTTTLRVVAGLERPQSGNITIDDRLVVKSDELFFEDPGKRGMNLVFQSYALWPHMTVFDNVAFPLTVKKISKEKIQEQVNTALKRMQIQEFVMRYPSELSGGQQQRVAIARAIVSEPKVLLLDEPLSNLDAKLRVEMRSELKRLHHDLGTTVLYVTHDQVEALTMSSRIAIFFEGVLEQVAPPMEIYQNPRSLKVAEFIGNPRINFLEGHGKCDKDGNFIVTSALGEMTFSKVLLTDDFPSDSEFDVVVGVRPEKIKINEEATANSVAGRIYIVQPAGSETTIQVTLDDKNELMIKEIDICNYETDKTVYIEANQEKINVFRKDTGRLIKRSVPD